MKLDRRNFNRKSKGKLRSDNYHVFTKESNFEFQNASNKNFLKRKSLNDVVFIEKKSRLGNGIQSFGKNSLKNKAKISKIKSKENSGNQNNQKEEKENEKKMNLTEKKRKYKELLKNRIKKTMMRPKDFYSPRKKNVDDFTSYLNFLGEKSRASNIANFNYFTELKFKED